VMMLRLWWGFVEEGLGALHQASVKGLVLYVFSRGLALCACRGGGHCYRRAASNLGGNWRGSEHRENRERAQRQPPPPASPPTQTFGPFVD